MISPSETGTLAGEAILDWGNGSPAITCVGSSADEYFRLDRLARTRLRLLDATSEGIYEIDPDGRCTFMNRAACRMLGYQFGQALGEKIHELHGAPPPGSPASPRFEQPFSESRVEGVFRRSDGRSFPVAFSCHAVSEDTSCKGTVVSFRDITGRTRIERRLKAQHAVGRALEGTESIEAIIPLLLQSLGESLQFCWGALWQVDETADVLRLSETWRSSPSGFEAFEETCRKEVFVRGQDLPGKVWVSAAPVWIPGAASDDSPHCLAAARAGFRSGFAIPIRLTENVFGVIEFLTLDDVPLDSDLLGILGLVGSGIGQVIERKRSESVRARQAAILEVAADFAGIVIDPAGAILSVSRSIENILGFTPPELIGQSLASIIPDYARSLREHGWPDDLAARGLKPCCIRMRGRRRSGEYVPLEASLGQHLENGSPVISGILRDITERALSEEMLERQAENLRRSEEALRHQTRLVNSIVTSMADGVIVADESGEIVLHNPAADTLIGDRVLSVLPSAELLVKHGYQSFLPDGETPCPLSELPLSRAVRGETVDCLELLFKTPQDPKGMWLNVTARPLIDNDGLLRGGVLVFRDVTGQKASREALRRAKDEAEAANRAKSEFLSRMSHELRTPMNAILGFAQLLEDESLTSEQSDAIRRILKAARHLLGLINEVLDISRIEAGRLNLQIEPLRPLEMMQAAIELIAPLAAQRGIRLVPPPPSDGQWLILADRQRLTQVFVNLLGNAVKYNREGGQIRVSFEPGDGQRLRMKVADSGLGIAPDQLRKLFVPFERLGAERSGVEGTGLGLAYSHRLVTAMGGNIGVESEVGKGSVFWLEASLAPVPERSKEILSSPAASVPPTAMNFDLGLASVLCIQDDPVSFREIGEVFGRLPGYELVSVQSGDQALQFAMERTPELVILDLQLPDMDGMEVLRRLRSQPNTQRTPIIVVSAALTDQIRQSAVEAGAHSCIAKPIPVRSFLDTVACLI